MGDSNGREELSFGFKDKRFTFKSQYVALVTLVIALASLSAYMWHTKISDLDNDHKGISARLEGLEKIVTHIVSLTEQNLNAHKELHEAVKDVGKQLVILNTFIQMKYDPEMRGYPR